MNNAVTLHEQILNVFCDINKDAAEIIRGWRSGNRQIYEKKSDKDVREVFTEADVAIEKMAKAKLSKAFPQSLLLGEEDFSKNKLGNNTELYFVIDPIDGTKQFIKDEDEWSISLAAIKNGIPIVASINMADKSETFTAIKSSGVFLNGIKLNNSGENDIKTLAVTSRQLSDAQNKRKIEGLGIPYKVIPAFTPKIGALLRGDVEAAVYFAQKGMSASLWDYAAAVLLVQEMGGTITSLDGSALPFSLDEVIHYDGWLATLDAGLHKKLLTKIIK